MGKHEIKPSLSQAVKLKKLKKAGTLTAEMIYEILSEAKGQAAREPKIDKTLRKFKRFFPDDYTPEQMSEVIMMLLTEWKSRDV